MNKREFETAISELTQPINDQYPRPWMTRLKNPLEARVFIVGRNQRNGYPTDRFDHARHMNGLFNRKGETCRGIYDEITAGKPSPTRHNTDRFVQKLSEVGVDDVLETNVICYSSPMSSSLALPEHRGGRQRGTELFGFLLGSINPSVIICHGTGTIGDLQNILGVTIPTPPDGLQPVVRARVGEHEVVVLPSLAPPKFNACMSWSDVYMDRVSRYVAKVLAKE